MSLSNEFLFPNIMRLVGHASVYVHVYWFTGFYLMSMHVRTMHLSMQWYMHINYYERQVDALLQAKVHNV